ncbi:hypothetical protein FJT64_008618 [Amphibalanus amphitrite]|uniref:Uncharacterized protein n=1 Tax=Amphibalanus amphitrite TaxID=1232801 RepID=A0A6A4VGW7_AMPAM|nr:hypothetical protein FJT64_008618 [Amphibalanus amphitrite]
MPATWSTDELTTMAKESYREHEGERVTEPGSELRQAIDTIHGDKWQSYSVDQALQEIGNITKHSSNPAVARKRFHALAQTPSEPIREFVVRCKQTAADCRFTCPSCNSDLTDWMLTDQITCGVQSEALQQELLLKHSSFSSFEALRSYSQALLMYRNTPLRDGGRSPAQLALGRHLRDSIPSPSQRYKLSPEWCRDLRRRELSMVTRGEKSKAAYDVGTKELSEMSVGDSVLCQDARTKAWDRRGVIVEKSPFRKYLVKMQGTGRVTIRNRRYLKLDLQK